MWRAGAASGRRSGKDAEQGRTVLFATHYLEEADAYADRIVLLRHGSIVADGTAAEIKSMAAGRTVRATLPGATEALLTGIPGADSVEIRGDTVLVHSTDSDAVARYLLTQTAAKDLEITAQGIEDAFLALTGDDRAEHCNHRSNLMSTVPSTIAPDLSARRVPPLGGFNFTVLKLEIRRLTRNRRTVIFAIVVPVVFFLLFGLNQAYDSLPAGAGSHGNVSAAVMISLALYGAVLCHHVLRRDGVHRAGPGLEPAAAADAAVAGRLHRHEDHDRAGARVLLGWRGVHRRPGLA